MKRIAFLAAVGVVSPSFIVILIIAECFEKFNKSKIISGCMTGIEPAVAGMIGTALLSVGGTVFFPDGITLNIFYSPELYISLIVFGIMTFLSFKKINPIVIIILSA